MQKTNAEDVVEQQATKNVANAVKLPVPHISPITTGHSREHISAIYLVTERSVKANNPQVPKDKVNALVTEAFKEREILKDKLNNLLKRDCCPDEVLLLQLSIKQIEQKVQQLFIPHE
ncbi:MAG: hypothetical protein GY751_02665 [Bacteroidetes bacterium]|nr:hypothetical protein [Bacteroidota bacterium]